MPTQISLFIREIRNILDHKPLMGEDPRVRGFFHGCGFNSGGMMFGEYNLYLIFP